MRPGVASIDCDHCFQFMYDLETGETEKWRGGPAPRVKGIPPPCATRCPKMGPDEYVSLLPQNFECVEHYLECSATGIFPDDPVVKRNAAILKSVERHVEKLQRNESMSIAALKTTVMQAIQETR